MQEYRKEKQILEEQVNRAKKKALHHDDHLRVVDAWFQEMLDEMKVIAGEYPENNTEKSPPLIPSSLYSADIEIFQVHLQDRSKDIKDVVSRLFSVCHSYSPDIVELQGRLHQQLAGEKMQMLEVQRLQSEVEELSERLDKAVERYMKAERKIERRLGKTSNISKTDEIFLGVQKVTPSDAPLPKREDTVMTNGINGTDETLTDLEEAHNKALAVSEKQREQLEHMEAENLKLNSQLTELVTKSTEHTDDEYACTDLFKQLKSQHEDVIRRVNNLEALNVQLREEAVKLQSERTAFRSQMENESKLAIGEKEAQLSQAEMNLARIRSNRDELLADQAIKRAAYEQERASVQKMKEIAEANDLRIKALETQNKRLQADQPKEASDMPELTSLAVEDLHKRHQTLERKHQMLDSELQSMEKAYLSMKKVADQKMTELMTLEDKVQRLSAEKAKADQKYFAAMKSKEIRDSEAKTLRLQNTKSSDVVSQLKEAESAHRALLINLEKDNAEIKEALAGASAKYQKTQQQVTELNISSAGLATQITELKRMLADKDSVVAASASSTRKAELELAELKATLTDTQRALELSKTNALGGSDVNDSFRVRLDASFKPILPCLCFCNFASSCPHCANLVSFSY